MTLVLNIYQYTDPAFDPEEGGDTRWIAAANEDAANLAATNRGWKPSGGQMLHTWVERHNPQHIGDYFDAGVDVVITDAHSAVPESVVKALLTAKGFLQFCWRDVSLNDYAEERRAAAEAAIEAALADSADSGGGVIEYEC
jgi:hypothetical protein